MTDGRRFDERVVEALASAGIEVVFGIGGTHTLPLLGALERADAPRYIAARTELGAAYMAIGYARAVGRPAAVLTSTGPGALNVAAALQDAVWSTIPLVHVTSYIDGDGFRGAVHETPAQAPLLAAASKRHHRIEDGGVDAVISAVEEAAAVPCGPVTVELPAQGWTVGGPPARERRDPARPSRAELGELLAALEDAVRPLVFCGGGVIRGGAQVETVELAERLGAPVVTSYQGRNAMASDHELYLGPLAGEKGLDELVAEADLAIVLGSKLTGVSTARWTMPLPDPTFRLDAAPRPHGGYPHLHDIEADLPQALSALADGPVRNPWAPGRPAGIRRSALAAAADRSPRDPEYLRALEAAGPLLAMDMTKGAFWAMKHLSADPATTIAFSGYLAMGTSLPMAIGMAAATGEPAVALVGDGGLQMSLAEIAVPAESRLPVTILAMVDGAYGLLRDNGRGVGGAERLGVELWNPEWADLAAACGIEHGAPGSPAELAAALATPPPGPRLLTVEHAFSREW